MMDELERTKERLERLEKMAVDLYQTIHYLETKLNNHVEDTEAHKA